MTFNSDSDPRKGAGVMYKDFSTIEKNIELLKTRKETLREMSRLLRNINTSREDCNDKLLVLEQNFANLVEKAKKKYDLCFSLRTYSKISKILITTTDINRKNK